MPHSPSILIADAQYLSSLGFTSLLTESLKLDSIYQVPSHHELENHLNSFKPDLVIIDHLQSNQFTIDSIDLIKSRSPSSKILVISNDQDSQRIIEIVEKGVQSFITRFCGKNEILLAVENTLKGDKFYCNKVLNIILKRTFPENHMGSSSETITSREKEILSLIAEGKIAKEISSALNISIHTIYTHRKNLMKKLKLKSPVELIKYALENHNDKMIR